MPISQVRSVTETSMIFMMPIPPTVNEMAAIPTSRNVKTWSPCPARCKNCVNVSIWKLLARLLPRW